MNYGKQHTDGSRSGGQPVTEPAWIEHDGSAACPVPAGKRVEVEWQSGKLGVFENGHNFRWVHIKRYRFSEKEQEAMGKDVPEIVASYPAKAEFACGPYEDGSGCEITIGYNLTQPRWENYITIDGYTVTFKAEHAEEVISAIRFCADAIRARNNIDSLANAAGGGK